MPYPSPETLIIIIRDAIFMGFFDFLNKLFGPKKKQEVLKCPNCAHAILLDMDRCPGCGLRINSLIKIKCPKCEASNEGNSAKCSECGASLADAHFVYRCHVCGNERETFFAVCEVCGTRMV